MRAADVAPPGAVLWPAAAASAVLALVGLAAAVAVSAASSAGLGALNAAGVASGEIDTQLLAGDRDARSIALRNLGAAALLAGGAATAGALTIIGIAVIGIGLGFSGAAVLTALGPLETLDRVAPYIVFELTGVVLATVAGLLPVTHALVVALAGRRSPLGAYSEALGRSLAMTGAAAALITIGAVIEAAVIDAHPL